MSRLKLLEIEESLKQSLAKTECLNKYLNNDFSSIEIAHCLVYLENRKNFLSDISPQIIILLKQLCLDPAHI